MELNQMTEGTLQMEDFKFDEKAVVENMREMWRSEKEKERVHSQFQRPLYRIDV